MWCIEHPIELSRLLNTYYFAMSNSPHKVIVNKKVIFDQLQTAIEFNNFFSHTRPKFPSKIPVSHNKFKKNLQKKLCKLVKQTNFNQ